MDAGVQTLIGISTAAGIAILMIIYPFLFPHIFSRIKKFHFLKRGHTSLSIVTTLLLSVILYAAAIGILLFLGQVGLVLYAAPYTVLQLL